MTQPGGSSGRTFFWSGYVCGIARFSELAVRDLERACDTDLPLSWDTFKGIFARCVYKRQTSEGLQSGPFNVAMTKRHSERRDRRRKTKPSKKGN